MDIDFVVTLIELQILFVWVLSYVSFFLLQFIIVLLLILCLTGDYGSQSICCDKRMDVFNGIAFVAKRIKSNE